MEYIYICVYTVYGLHQMPGLALRIYIYMYVGEYTYVYIYT